MKRYSILGLVAGLLLIASSAAHAFLGWPPFGAALAEAGIEGDIIGALAVGWYFGSTAMLVFGVIVLAAAFEGGTRRRAASAQGPGAPERAGAVRRRGLEVVDRNHEHAAPLRR